MRPSLLFLCLFFLLFEPSATIPMPPLFTRFSGHAHQCEALLQFGNSLGITTLVNSRYFCNQDGANITSYPRTTSWRRGTDCCTWDGITCDNVTGDVVEVDLSCSCLGGTLHPNSTLFSLLNLRTLYLRGNALTGDIPSSICRMRSLENLSFADNKFGGPIPPCLGNLSKLSHFSLSFNRIQGSLPRSLANCTRLTYLSLFSNNITGSFPHWLRMIPLEVLQVGDNNFHGHIGPDPVTLDFPHLNFLILARNNFAGNFPTEYFLESNLTYIDISHNKFEGTPPMLTPTLGFYDISGNRFTGQIIDTLICNSTMLRNFALTHNRLFGSLPRCLLDGTVGLLDLSLSGNSFSGPIPKVSSMPGNCSLRHIHLSENLIQGKLPRFLANCSELEILDFSNNDIEDSYPSWLEALQSLLVLSLSSNKLGGLINNSGSTQPFPKLHILDLANNNFHGAFPTQYIRSFRGMMGGDEKQGNIVSKGHDMQTFYSTSYPGKGVILDFERTPRALALIDLSCNHFEGEISDVIGDLKSLIGLNFSQNRLTGTIPYSLGNLTNLEWLDLSANNLSGEIPGSLIDLTSLAYLNLSMNQLVGPIPKGKQFNTFKSDSFMGNPGLCGFPLQRKCGGDTNEPPPLSTLTDEEDTDNGSWIEWRAVLMGYGTGTVCGISIGYIMLHFMRPLWLMRMLERIIYKLQRRARRTRARSSTRTRRR